MREKISQTFIPINAVYLNHFCIFPTLMLLPFSTVYSKLIQSNDGGLHSITVVIAA